jgi:hypothetical protein
MLTLLSSMLLTRQGLAVDNTSDDLRKRFMEEAPAQWAKYQELMANVQGVISSEYSSTEPRQNGSTRIEYKVGSGGKLRVYQSLLPIDAGNSVCAFNSKYAFTLTRKTAGDSWVLTFQERINRDGKIPEKVSRPISWAMSSVAGLTHLYIENLIEMVRKPYFRVISVAPVKTNSGELVEITFDYQHKVGDSEGNKPYNPVQSGLMVLDPANFWLLRSCQLNLSYSNSKRKATRVDEYVTSSMVPLPKRSVRTEEDVPLNGPASYKLSVTSDFDLRLPSTLPDESEFTLSAFGMAEPAGIHWSTPTPLFLWIFLVAASLLVVAVVVGLLKRRLFGGTS